MNNGWHADTNSLTQKTSVIRVCLRCTVLFKHKQYKSAFISECDSSFKLARSEIVYSFDSACSFSAPTLQKQKPIIAAKVLKAMLDFFSPPFRSNQEQLTRCQATSRANNLCNVALCG